MVFAQSGRYDPWASSIADMGIWSDSVHALNFDCAAHLKEEENSLITSSLVKSQLQITLVCVNLSCRISFNTTSNKQYNSNKIYTMKPHLNEVILKKWERYNFQTNIKC